MAARVALHASNYPRGTLGRRETGHDRPRCGAAADRGAHAGGSHADGDRLRPQRVPVREHPAAVVSEHGVTQPGDLWIVPGEKPALAASFRGSAEQLVWSDDGRRLLVVAADPGSYSRDVSGTFVTAAHQNLSTGSDVRAVRGAAC